MIHSERVYSQSRDLDEKWGWFFRRSWIHCGNKSFYMVLWRDVSKMLQKESKRFWVVKKRAKGRVNVVPCCLRTTQALHENPRYFSAPSPWAVVATSELFCFLLQRMNDLSFPDRLFLIRMKFLLPIFFKKTSHIFNSLD